MSLKLDPTLSIHRRLLILLLPPLALLMVAGGFADYRASMVFMRTAYDQSLTDAAFAQAGLIKVVDGKIDAPLPAQPATHTSREKFYYSVWGPDGALVSGNAQLVPVMGDGNPVYADTWLGEHRIRIVSYHVPTALGS